MRLEQTFTHLSRDPGVLVAPSRLNDSVRPRSPALFLRGYSRLRDEIRKLPDSRASSSGTKRRRESLICLCRHDRG